MRVLFTALPATGHVHAIMPLGMAVKEARTPERIGPAIQEVLTHERYRSATAAFAAEMAALPPISHAVELLEQLARDRRPLRRHPSGSPA